MVIEDGQRPIGLTCVVRMQRASIRQLDVNFFHCWIKIAGAGMKLFRRLLATSAPIAEITPAQVAGFLQRLTKQDQYAVFDLPAKNAFAQMKRSPDGGLHVEASRRTAGVEALLKTLGDVTFIDDYGFPATDAKPGDDERVAQVIAQVIALLAAESGVANQVRARTG